MRKIFAWVGTVVGLGGASLLSKANWVANHLGVLGLPDEVRGALIAMSYFPMLATASFLIIGIGCLIFLIHAYGLDRAPIQWARKAIARIGYGAPAPDNLLNRLAEAERVIDQNKADLGQLRTKVEMLTRALRLRDAESRIKEADQVIMPSSKTGTAKTLLEESYPDEAAWAADHAVWERAMRQIDIEWLQWQPHDKPFLDIRLNDLQGAPTPPPQSNIESQESINQYKAVWVVQQRYAKKREDIIQYFFFKARELPG